LFIADAQETVIEKLPLYLFNVDENIVPIAMLGYVVNQNTFSFRIEIIH
jgi:hypothetical protein